MIKHISIEDDLIEDGARLEYQMNIVTCLIELVKDNGPLSLEDLEKTKQQLLNRYKKVSAALKKRKKKKSYKKKPTPIR